MPFSGLALASDELYCFVWIEVAASRRLIVTVTNNERYMLTGALNKTGSSAMRLIYHLTGAGECSCRHQHV